MGVFAVRWTRLGWRSAVATLALCLVPAASVGAAQTTALAVRVATPARAVHGSDGREHVEYDLVITNAFTASVGLDSIRVLSGRKLLLALNGTALAEHTFALGVAMPTATIPVSSSVKALVDVVLPRSFGRRVPRRLTERIRYTVPRDAPGRVIVGSTVVRGPTVRIDAQAPIRIASPLYGSGWIDGNGCCGDPTSEHRSLLLPADGSYRTQELFAIDWIREIGGSFFKGEGTKLTDYVCYGAPIHAVANGIVVAAVNNRPEVPPNATTAENPTVQGPPDFGGDRVVERIAPGEYAAYLHMQTGSVRVRVGQRLRTGQVIGLLGNSGNTTAPHLHFGIQDRPDVFASNSLPFEIGSFTVQGTGGAGPRPGTITITGKPHRAILSEPLVRAVYRF